MNEIQEAKYDNVIKQIGQDLALITQRINRLEDRQNELIAKLCDELTNKNEQRN